MLTYLYLWHKLHQAGVECPQVEDGTRPDRLEEPLRGAGAGLRSSVPAVQQSAGDDTRVVLVTVGAVVAPRKGAHPAITKDGANGLCAVYTPPVLPPGGTICKSCTLYRK